VIKEPQYLRSEKSEKRDAPLFGFCFEIRHS
jgi:hypothetical protein